MEYDVNGVSYKLRELKATQIKNTIDYLLFHNANSNALGIDLTKLIKAVYCAWIAAGKPKNNIILPATGATATTTPTMPSSMQIKKEQDDRFKYWK